MSALTGFVVVVLATVIATWYNDHISRAEYLNDESLDAR